MTRLLHGARAGLWLVMLAAVLGVTLLGGSSAQAQDVFDQRTGQQVNPDTVEARRFDDGRMWTFEMPPLDYFEERYDFRPDDEWLERARLGAVRIPGCTASFVSPQGLLMTNHHCGRSHAASVSREGENILQNGFYARRLNTERPVESMYADQLIAITDVTDAMRRAVQSAQTDAERADARQAAADSIEQSIAEAADEAVRVEVTPLYNGGRYSAYTFRRYEDVRLVMIPELQIGYFGGDTDNFTYPRYTMDVALFRVYNDAGEPLQTEHYFPWSTDGSRPGDATFVVGNPGSTLRLETAEQLEFRRDVQDVNLLRVLEGRVAALKDFAESQDAVPDAVQNQIFSLQNGVKLYRGRVEALRDGYIMARIRAGDREFQETLRTVDSLQQAYGGLIGKMADIQEQKRELAPSYQAFRLMTSPYASATLRRAFFAVTMPPGSAQSEQGRQQIQNVGAQPSGLDRRFLEHRLELFEMHFGAEDSLTQAALQGQTPANRAERIVAESAFATSDAALSAYDRGSVPEDDPAVALVRSFLDTYRTYQSGWSGLTAQQEDVAETLGRARFAVYGTAVPPDATFSLRISDGVVRGYDYNGTVAPPYTTFYGMYEHFTSYGEDSAWDLPDAWQSPPDTFDRSKPLNLVTTNDITGGNSGSPLLNKDLEVVGLVFDGNIESLAGDYIFLPGRIRAISVDVRGMIEALDEIYDADRLVQEATGKAFVRTEEAAGETR